jgi:hypothetical protein
MNNIRLGPFKIVRGSVRENYYGFSYREGWWWFNYGSDPLGYGFSPEGPFDSKSDAIKHLRWTIRHVMCPGKYIMNNHKLILDFMPIKRPTMRIVSGTIPIGSRLVKLREF